MRLISGKKPVEKSLIAGKAALRLAHQGIGRRLVQTARGGRRAGGVRAGQFDALALDFLHGGVAADGRKTLVAGIGAEKQLQQRDVDFMGQRFGGAAAGRLHHQEEAAFVADHHIGRRQAPHTILAHQGGALGGCASIPGCASGPGPGRNRRPAAGGRVRLPGRWKAPRSWRALAIGRGEAARKKDRLTTGLARHQKRKSAFPRPPISCPPSTAAAHPPGC